MEAPFEAFGGAIRGVWSRYSGRLEPPFFDNYFNFYNDEGND